MHRTLLYLLLAAQIRAQCVKILDGFSSKDWYSNPEEALTSHPDRQVPVPMGGRVMFVEGSVPSSASVAMITLAVPNNESSLQVVMTAMTSSAKSFRVQLALDSDQWQVPQADLRLCEPDAHQLNWTLNRSLAASQNLLITVYPLPLSGRWLAITDIEVWSCSGPSLLPWLPWLLAGAGITAVALAALAIHWFQKRRAIRYQDLPLTELNL